MLSENDFSEKIIERGITYYEQGLVEILTKIDGVICSKVNGYDVHIGIGTYGCSCPCYAYQENCKHLYALLLKIKDCLSLGIFEDNPYYDTLKELDDLMHRYATTIPEFRPRVGERILDVGSKLMDEIMAQDAAPDHELMEQIGMYEDIIKEIDKEDLFWKMMIHLYGEPPMEGEVEGNIMI
jgi:uncharacterized Zn finger protein